MFAKSLLPVALLFAAACSAPTQPSAPLSDAAPACDLVRSQQSANAAALAAMQQKIAGIEGATATVIESEHVQTFESLPPFDQFRVTVDTNVPGWAIYLVEVNGSTCVAGEPSLVDEE